MIFDRPSLKLVIKRWRKWLEKKLFIKEYLSLDIETSNLDMTTGTVHIVTYDFNGSLGHFMLQKESARKGDKVGIPKEIAAALKDPNVTKIIHSSQFDLPYLRMKTGIHIRNVWDTQLMELIILAGVYKENPYIDSSLANTLKRRKIARLNKKIRTSFIGYKGRLTDEQVDYALGDIEYLHTLALAQLKDIKKMDLVNVAKLENLDAEVTAEMRYNGIEFDEKMWREIAKENEAELKRRLKALPKEVDNWNSPKQVKEYFLKKHGIKIKTYKELHKLGLDNPIMEKFKHMQSMTKAVSSYGIGFLTTHDRYKNSWPTVNKDGRIRAGYTQIIETGRYSMNSPNLQQLPAKGRHRECFMSRKGYSLVVGDFTGQELGVIAAGSKDPTWIEPMKLGHDIHSVMAAKIFPDWKQVGLKDCKFPLKCDCPEHKKRRRPAKDLNFGLAYGKGAESFAEESGMKLRDAYKIIRKYKGSIPKIVKWLESNGRFAIKNGWIRTLPPFGRLRKVIGEAWKKRNRGMNSPVQGSGADMMKLAMCMIYCYIYDNNLDVKMVLTVHDELLTEAKDGEAFTWKKIMRFFMEEAAMFITGDKIVTTRPEIMKRWKPKD